MLRAVITTIQAPTPGMTALTGRLAPYGGRLIVVGDAKGPAEYPLDRAEFLSLEHQLSLPWRLPSLLPTGHYARKIVGYLEAVRQGATCIYETDDDNMPLGSWQMREECLSGVRKVTGCAGRMGPWLNVYRHFSGDLIWPRGLPLDAIRHADPGSAWDREVSAGDGLRVPVQQGLVNGSPDVDAVWRLTMDRPFEFERRGALLLEQGQWCPFNSQNTWWWPVAYPLMYIPSYCTFRMCDIWRSLVAQRCLWAAGFGVAFYDADVVQERNPHDLMRDFHDEIPGYERNAEMAALLMQVPLQPGPGSVAGNLLRCYEMLIKARFFPPQELDLVQAWLEDLMRAGIVV